MDIDPYENNDVLLKTVEVENMLKNKIIYVYVTRGKVFYNMA